MVNDDLTYRIIGSAMKVHRTLGGGFQEVIYQRALAIEMARAGIDFGREVEQPIYYEGVEIGSRRADFIVGNSVVVELKALAELEAVHLVQVKNYVAAYGFSLGLLLNFGGPSLEYRRIFGN
jgi:GxxExxY protein